MNKIFEARKIPYDHLVATIEADISSLHRMEGFYNYMEKQALFVIFLLEIDFLVEYSNQVGQNETLCLSLYLYCPDHSWYTLLYSFV